MRYGAWPVAELKCHLTRGSEVLEQSATVGEKHVIVLARGDQCHPGEDGMESAGNGHRRSPFGLDNAQRVG